MSVLAKKMSPLGARVYVYWYYCSVGTFPWKYTNSFRKTLSCGDILDGPSDLNLLDIESSQS